MSEAIRIELFDIAPELAVEDADTAGLEKINRFIGRAQKYVNADAVGDDDYNLLVAYKTAHLMTLAKPGSVADGNGALLKEKVDNSEYTFANSDEAKMKRAKEFSDEFERRIDEIVYIVDEAI